MSGTDGAVSTQLPSLLELNTPTEVALLLPESSDVSVTLHSLVDGSTVQCPVTEAGLDQFRVSILPLTRGRHEFRVQASSKKTIATDPVFVYCPPQQLGKPVHIIEGLSRPAGIAVRGNSELIVTEMEPPGVSLWSKEGKKLRNLEPDDIFDNPYGVDIDSKGCCYVADLIRCNIFKFSADGVFLKACEVSDQIAFPAGVKVGPDDRVYVCDDSNQKILIFNQELELQTSFGESGNDAGQLLNPSDLAFDQDGSLFVADTKRGRIIKFSSEGKFVTEFEVKGQRAELELGLCINRGYIYVSDFWNSRVIVFKTTGEFVVSLGEEGAKPGDFDQPAGIAVDVDGFLYVCDERNNRVQVF